MVVSLPLPTHLTQPFSSISAKRENGRKLLKCADLSRSISFGHVSLPHLSSTRNFKVQKLPLRSLKSLKKLSLPAEIVRNASLALLFHKIQEAEAIYTQNKYYYRAILMDLDGYRWERALKLARDYKVHLDLVVAFRKKYLERIGK